MKFVRVGEQYINTAHIVSIKQNEKGVTIYLTNGEKLQFTGKGADHVWFTVGNQEGSEVWTTENSPPKEFAISVG